jgi:hypothetical protein
MTDHPLKVFLSVCMGMILALGVYLLFRVIARPVSPMLPRSLPESSSDKQEPAVEEADRVGSQTPVNIVPRPTPPPQASAPSKDQQPSSPKSSDPVSKPSSPGPSANLRFERGDVRFGLTELQRMAVWREKVWAEDRADDEGVARDRYFGTVANRHGLTIAQLLEISDEALLENWPLPPPRY